MVRLDQSVITTAILVLFATCIARSNLSADENALQAGLRKSLLFHASFDGRVDADLAQGDPKIYTSVKPDRTAPQPGLLTGTVGLAQGKGRYGDALRFERYEGPRAVLFQGGRNVAYREQDWNGTVSFWLRLDPDRDLSPGYCDPVQITERAWNDAAFFVDFTKDETPRHFRLGVFSDLKFWNPDGLAWEEIPASDRPLVVVERPPFGRDKWTHVAFTFAGINSEAERSASRLYLDGRLQGVVERRRQVFTWDPSKARMMLGLAYVGLFDDLAVFDRALSAEEVETVSRLDQGIRGLRD